MTATINKQRKQRDLQKLKCHLQDNQRKKVILTPAGTNNFKQPRPELSRGGNETIMISRFTTSH